MRGAHLTLGAVQRPTSCAHRLGSDPQGCLLSVTGAMGDPVTPDWPL